MTTNTRPNVHTPNTFTGIHSVETVELGKKTFTGNLAFYGTGDMVIEKLNNGKELLTMYAPGVLGLLFGVKAPGEDTFAVENFDENEGLPQALVELGVGTIVAEDNEYAYLKVTA